MHSWLLFETAIRAPMRVPGSTILVALLAGRIAVSDPWGASASDSVYDSPQHMACLQAPTPECLFDLALANIALGNGKEPDYGVRLMIGQAQLRAGRAADAVRTLQQ